MDKIFRGFSLILILGLFLVPVQGAQAAPGNTTRVSMAADGTQGNSGSFAPSISADGRYVAFSSDANNLVSRDTNLERDVFVHDRQTGQTSLISVASGGTQGDSKSYSPSISADGRYVAFLSDATNLVSGDTNSERDVFVHDRQTGQTTRVSVASDGSQGNAGSYWARISSDGRFVAFESFANNLVSGDTNGYYDVFVHDRQTGQTTRVSVASDGTQGTGYSGFPSLSADGRYVTFDSRASNLVTGDTNGTEDVFLHDRETGQTARLSVASDGTQSNSNSHYSSISADGRYVAFFSTASNLVSGDTNVAGDIFVRDRQTGQTTLVSVASDGSQGDKESYGPFISADGRYVSFDSYATNLVSGDTNGAYDIFVHDLQAGHTTRVSVASTGSQGNSDSNGSSLSTDGRYVAFDSVASNLVSGDTNTAEDIFVHENRLSDPAQITISGYADEAGATLSYTDGTLKTAAADDDGFYSFQVPYGWSGTVTPSKPRYEFSPASRTYSNLTAGQPWQNYTAIPEAGPLVWFNTFLGGSANDFATALTRDSSGNLYLAGKAYSSFGSPIRPYTGLSDAVVAKFSPAGALQWLTFLGGASYDQAYDLEVDSNGNVYLFGSSHAAWGTPLYDYTPALRNAFLVKLNANGALQWNLFYSNTTTSGGIVLDESGNIYTAGEFIQPYIATTDIFVAKFDTNGTFQWESLLGSTGPDDWPDITRDPSGNLYVIGHSEQTWGTPVNGYSGSVDVFAAKLNASGVLQWNTFMGGTSFDFGQRVAMDGSGDLYIAGNGPESWGTPLNPYTPGESDISVVRINGSTGGRVWNTFLGGTGFDTAFDIKLTPAGTVYVAGGSDAAWGTPRLPYHGLEDVVVAVLNNAGAIQWTGFVGGPGDDFATGLVLGPNDEVFLAGSSNAAWGSPLNPYSGGQDALLVKLGPPLLISGNAAAPGVIMNYDSGGPQTVVADGTGYYEIGVRPGWSGTVTPSNPGFEFSPPSISYSNLTQDQTEQNYRRIPLVRNIEVYIGGNLQSGHLVQTNGNQRVSYPGLNNGPVKVTSPNGTPLIASERVAYFDGSNWTSFSELMGLPSNQLTTSYVLPWYNNADLNTQLRFGNVGTVNTFVTVTIGGVTQGSYPLAPNQSTRISYPGLNSGPVVISSSGNVPIIASERVAYFNGTAWSSFSELMGLPTSRLTTSYTLPWYNNAELNTQLRFGNVGSAPTNVTVTVAGQVQGTYYLNPSQALRLSYPALNNGPVKIESSGGVPIIASERVAYFDGSNWTDFSELMALPSSSLTTTYWLPYYNNAELNTQVRFGNVGSAPTYVTVTIGGVVRGAYLLYPSQAMRMSYPGLNSGPVKISSSGGVPIIASERVAYFDGSNWASFSELMGLPDNQLHSSYLLPWYNNMDLNTQLRFGVP